jgi:hypothetical protein
MSRTLKVTLAAMLAALHSAFAYNQIHESSYNIQPRGMFSAPVTLSVSGFVDPEYSDQFGLPVSFAFKATRQFEIGAGLQSGWDVGEGRVNVPYLVFGAKFLSSGATTFQGDLMFPANSGSNMGMSLAMHRRFGGELFTQRVGLRAGTMDALVDGHALMSFEASYFPALNFSRGFAFEFGMFASSQTSDFDGHLGMDLQPGFIVPLSRGSSLQPFVIIPLAGDNAVPFRAQILINIGF